MSRLVPESCKLCRFVEQTRGLDPPAPSPAGEVQPVALFEDEYWIAALNENQATLGRVYFVLKRHETDVARLTEPEQSSLWRQVASVNKALTGLFAPDHFNYMFLMNLVRHTHFHIYPRYAEPRTFAGLTFEDNEYGGHYDPSADRRLDDATRDALVVALCALA